MVWRPVRSGMPVRQALTARKINELTKEQRVGDLTPDPLPPQERRLEVYGQLWQGTSTDRIEPFEPVLMYQPYTILNTNDATYPDRIPDRFLLKVDKLSNYNRSAHGWLPQWGIAQEAITLQRAGRVLMSGMSWLKVPATIGVFSQLNLWGLDILEGVLSYRMFGRAEILCPPFNSAGNQSHYLVNLTRRVCYHIYATTPVGGIPAGGKAACTLVQPYETSPFWQTHTGARTEDIWNPNTSVAIPGNKRTVAVEYMGRYLAVFVEC